MSGFHAVRDCQGQQDSIWSQKSREVVRFRLHLEVINHYSNHGAVMVISKKY